MQFGPKEEEAVHTNMSIAGPRSRKQEGVDLGEAIVFLEYGGGASHGYDGASVVSLVADYSALGTLCGVASFEVQGRKGWC